MDYHKVLPPNNDLKQATDQEPARFCLLEQLLPDGKDHPFSQTMMAHFNKLGTPLGAVEKYPTVSAQKLRFQDLGWPTVSVCNLWNLWSRPELVSSSDREYLDTVEPFDEWEEFALFGCHYFLLVADTDQSPAYPLLPAIEVGCSDSNQSFGYTVDAIFTEYPKGQGCRRFAAALPLASQQRAVDDIGVFAGMGAKTRSDSYDVYSSSPIEQNLGKPHRSHITPSSRMCHTITDLGDVGALLVGGRTSPDTGLVDCWLYHKYLDVWERVDDLPQPLYRHQAVDLGGGFVLVSTGRVNSRTISTDYLVWSRRTGWLKCAHNDEIIPLPTYGATFGRSSTAHSSSPVFGVLAGGMTLESAMQQASWRWELHLPDNLRHHQPIMSFRRLDHFESHVGLARFGASVICHQDQTYVVGGIVKDEMLMSGNEICAFQHHENEVTCSPLLLNRSCELPRPLLVGTTVVSTGHSLLIMGGSAVCFSFGTFWNRGCFELCPRSQMDKSSSTIKSWKCVRTVEAEVLHQSLTVPAPEISAEPTTPKLLPRTRVSSPEEFEKIVQTRSPVILEGLDIGPCTVKWTADYLKNQIGLDREVSYSIHYSLKANSVGRCSRSYIGAHELHYEEFCICY